MKSGQTRFLLIFLGLAVFISAGARSLTVQARIDNVTAGKGRLVLETDQGSFFVTDDGGDGRLHRVKYFLDLIDRKRLVTLEVDERGYVQHLDRIPIALVLDPLKKKGVEALAPVSGTILTVLIEDYRYDRGQITLVTNFGKMVAEKGLTEFEPQDEVTLAHAMLTREPVCLVVLDGRVLKFVTCQTREP
jgi:hypothetical protein